MYQILLLLSAVSGLRHKALKQLGHPQSLAEIDAAPVPEMAQLESYDHHDPLMDHHPDDHHEPDDHHDPYMQAA